MQVRLLTRLSSVSTSKSASSLCSPCTTLSRVRTLTVLVGLLALADNQDVVPLLKLRLANLLLHLAIRLVHLRVEALLVQRLPHAMRVFLLVSEMGTIITWRGDIQKGHLPA